MFPKDYTDDVILKNEQQTEQTENSKTVKTSLLFDFEKKRFVVTDGKPSEIMTIDAVKQWIALFINTMINGAEIYEGTKFGHSLRKLKGYKKIGNGYIESEVEREVREGLLLCPAIEKVVYFNLQKDGKFLIMYIRAQLYSGETIEVSQNV